MKIYDDKLAPNPRRVRIFMAEKGIAVPYEQVAIVKGEDWGELNRERALSALPWLDAGLAGKEFVAGEHFSIADITAMCAVDFGRIWRFKIPEDCADAARWYKSVAARPSAQA